MVGDFGRAVIFYPCLQNYVFQSSPKTEKRKSTMISDPNVVSSEQEEADIAKG